MAKKSSVAKNIRRAQMVARHAEKRAALKAIISNQNTDEEARFEAIKKLTKMPRDTSRIRVRNRCAITGRCRGFLRKFQMSRLCFRELANNGIIPGVIKASW